VKNKTLHAAIKLLITMSMLLVSCSPAVKGPTDEDRFYAGMRAYCYYIPQYYLNFQPVYMDEMDCYDIVQEAQNQDLWHTQKKIKGIPLPAKEAPGTGD
jgi:hypothetical protein